jgi:hypothetical protein
MTEVRLSGLPFADIRRLIAELRAARPDPSEDIY